MDSITIAPSKKAQLHEVADLMLEIYRTLVRMRYLDSSWIQEGPHNVDALIPMYRSHGVDDTVIYLYSILPYVDTGGVEEVDFLQGSQFADFRQESDVEQARNPFCDDKDMPSHFTALSLLGNHRSAIVYNTRRHGISITDQEWMGSTDHNIDEGWISEDEADENGCGSDEDNSDDGNDDDGKEEDEGNNDEEDGDEDDEEDGDEDEDGDDEEEDEDDDMDMIDNEYDEGRPAGRVLRDIARWYNELIELPGDGDNSGAGWNRDLTKPLYLKHGWPHAFDGDAFLVDKARATALDAAKSSLEEPSRKVHNIEYDLGDKDRPSLKRKRENLAGAKTSEEEWAARWELWREERSVRPDMEDLRKAKEERDGVKHEEVPLWEVRQLRETLQWKQEELERMREEGGPVLGSQARLRYAEEEVEVLRKAYEASRADADRLFPGRSSTPDPRVEELAGLKDRREKFTRGVEESQAEVIAVTEWMAQLPAVDADRAREWAQKHLDVQQRSVEACSELCRGVAEALEKYALPADR